MATVAAASRHLSATEAVAKERSEEWKSSTKRETLGVLEHELQRLLATSAENKLDLNRKELSGFRNLFSRFLRAKTFVDWSKIQPLPENAIQPYAQLPGYDKTAIAAMLSKLVVVKLNGGLGTSMGCKGPKSVISVRNDLTFLDLTMQQIQTLNKTYDVDVPLVLMNSFNTDDDTQKLLKKYANVKVAVHSFCQSRYPRINKETLMPIVSDIESADHEAWYPPGHGNFYEAFHNSGLLDKFIAEGKEYCFLSNIDNMGATVDLSILNFVLNASAGGVAAPEFVMEVTDKTRADVKGGTLIQYENKLMLLEIAQVPKDYVDEFKSVSKFRIFNTNNLWVHLGAMKRNVEQQTLDMEVIVNPKHLDRGLDVIQLETAAGAAIKNFKGACGINVPRSRFHLLSAPPGFSHPPGIPIPAHLQGGNGEDVVEAEGEKKEEEAEGEQKEEEAEGEEKEEAEGEGEEKEEKPEAEMTEEEKKKAEKKRKQKEKKKEKEAKRREKKEKEKKEKGGKKDKHVDMIKEMLRAKQEAEEAEAKRVQEENERYEAALKAQEEEDRLRKEQKEVEKKRKQEKIDELKKAGKYLTPAQKAKHQATLAKPAAQNIVVTRDDDAEAGAADKPKKRILYDTKKKIGRLYGYDSNPRKDVYAHLKTQPQNTQMEFQERYNKIVGEFSDQQSFPVNESKKMEVDKAAKKRETAKEGGEKEEEGTFDKNLYSRQLYTLGESAMMHLREASVLISGLSGLGVELAKNLVLGGMRHVSIHDTKAAGWHDLSAQYYLTEDDLEKNRAAACFNRLAELNDSVQTSLNTDELTKEYVSGFDLVILVDSTRATQLQVAEWTRAAGRRLLVTDARGLFSYVFLDCGEEFRVDDANGENCKEFHIEHIESETGDVMTIENSHHGLEDGDHVTFSEIKGMVELNQCAPIKITVKKPHIFNIGDAAKQLTPYVEGGRGKQVKVPFTISHKPLAASLEEPEYAVWDFAKFDYPAKLHALWSALYAFEEKHGRSPAPRSASDAALLKAELRLPEGEEVSDDLLALFANSARGNLVTVASVVGGIAAQEAMKAVTHHMTPLKQWLYLDAIEAVPGQWTALDNAKLTEADCAARNSRYDGQAAVFGWKFQEQLLKQRWFIVGSGAIGCELLKNMAMMGLGCGEGGLIKITDMDQIEISNLNRQFLFRRADVGSKKAEVAARAVLSFNYLVNMKSMAERVCASTEHIFTRDFFVRLNGVVSALDSFHDRLYLDSRSERFRTPMLDAGTVGTKGNTQVVYPEVTVSYGSSADPPEKEVPFSIRCFPNEITHTIQWARSLFEGVFSEPVETANRFIKDKRLFLEQVQQMNTSQQMDVLTSVKKLLVDECPKTAEDCIRWSRFLFQENHHDSIAQMLHAFPPDQVTDSGAKFWSGLKRCPHTLNFDPAQEMHFDLVYAGSILRAEVFGIKPILDRDVVAKIASAIQVSPFKPRDGVRIAVIDAEAMEQGNSMDVDDMDEQLDEFKRKLALIPSSTAPLTPIDFEKDDDSNHHIEFITAASNLRAENYDIARADKMQTKQIAGRIIPAIATTTATAAGLVCIELYKTIVADEEQWKVSPPLDRFKNGFYNLALPFFVFSEPIRPEEEEEDEGGESIDEERQERRKGLKRKAPPSRGLVCESLSDGDDSSRDGDDPDIPGPSHAPPSRARRLMNADEYDDAVAKRQQNPHDDTDSD